MAFPGTKSSYPRPPQSLNPSFSRAWLLRRQDEVLPRFPLCSLFGWGSNVLPWQAVSPVQSSRIVIQRRETGRLSSQTSFCLPGRRSTMGNGSTNCMADRGCPSKTFTVKLYAGARSSMSFSLIYRRNARCC